FLYLSFFFNYTASSDIYTLSLHDALPISYLSISPLHDIFRSPPRYSRQIVSTAVSKLSLEISPLTYLPSYAPFKPSEISKLNLRSEEHTSELQSQSNLVCRLLLEKKKKKK